MMSILFGTKPTLALTIWIIRNVLALGFIVGAIIMITRTKKRRSISSW